MADGKVLPSSSHGVAFEEFRLLFESTEKVVDRRLELNRANASLSILVVGGLGVIAGWAYGTPAKALIAVIAIFVVSILAIYFCLWWKAQITAYKELNAGKV